jgi:hypothetical protein
MQRPVTGLPSWTTWWWSPEDPRQRCQYRGQRHELPGWALELRRCNYPLGPGRIEGERLFDVTPSGDDIGV